MLDSTLLDHITSNTQYLKDLDVSMYEENLLTGSVESPEVK